MSTILEAVNARLLVAVAAVPDQDRSAVAKQGLDAIVALMKSRGYKLLKTKQSAMFEWVFSKGDPRKEYPSAFALTGWHGNGRYEDEVAVFSLYELGTVVVDAETDISADEQQRVVTKILNHLKKQA